METERCSRIVHAGKSNITVLQRRLWDQFNVTRPTDNLGLKARLSFVFLVVNYSIVAVLSSSTDLFLILHLAMKDKVIF